MQQGTSTTGSAGGTATLSDEQILGLEPEGGRVPGNDAGQNVSSGTDVDEEIFGRSAPQNDNAQSVAADPARGASNDGSNDAPANPASADDPAWLKALESQPQGGADAAAEARRWRDAASDVIALDAAYFSADSAARSGLATRLYDSDPAAFRAMLAESARMLSERDPQALADLARQLGAADQTSAPPARSVASAASRGAHETLARTQNPRVPPASPLEAALPAPAAGENPSQRSADNGAAAPAFPAEAYRHFEAATNDDVSRRMRDAIDRTLASTLPEGIAPGARRRIGEDIFEEVHVSLANDRDLTRQVSELLRGWHFDSASRQQIAGLVAGRARAVLPEVARRVVAEWTSSVLGSDRAKTARIDAAASRRDITGGRLPESVPSSSLRPRDIDYHRTSDEQILAM